MKTALLVCDHVPEQFAKDHGDYPMMFTKLLAPADLKVHFVVNDDFPDVEDYDAFVVTGSKYGVYDDIPWIHELKQFTRDAYSAGKKYLGVCFGHQMMAEALGGKVEKSERGYLIGLHTFTIRHQPTWMEPKVSEYRALMLCQDQVVKLPEDSQVLACNEQCPVGLFMIDKHFLGIQGHPEFTKDYNQAIFESRSQKIGTSKITDALLSFKEEPDTQLIKTYFHQFLEK